MRQPMKRHHTEGLEFPSREHTHVAHNLIARLGEEDGEDPADVERAQLLNDIATAERQIDRGEGVEHEAAKAELLRRLRR